MERSDTRLDMSPRNLKISPAHLSALIENTEDMLASFDHEMHVLVFNAAYRAWIEDLDNFELYVGMGLDEILPQDLYDQMFPDCERALTGIKFCKEFSYDFGGDDQRAFLVSFNPIVQHGSVVGFAQLIKNVTERKRAEEALLESEQRFRNLFENSPDAVFVEDFSGNVLDVNPAACHLHHMRREELVGKNFLDLVPPYWQDQAKRGFTEMVAKQRERVEGFSLAQDGRVVPVEIGVTHIDYFSRPALLLQVRDITARKSAEIAQLRRNRELAMLNRASQALTSVLDQNQILAIVVEEVRRLLGVFACSIWLVDEEADELVCHQASGPKSDMVLGWRLARDQGIAGWVASTGESLLVGDTQTDERHFWGVANRIQYDLRSILTVPLRARQKVIGVLQVVDQEVGRFTHDDMTLLEPLAVAAAIAIENARLVEGLEEEVAARTAEILSERDMREAILQSAGDAIVMVGEDMRIQYGNPAFEKLTGYTTQQVLGQVVTQLLWDDVAEQERGALQRACEQGTGWRGEMVIRGKDGRLCETTMIMAPIRDVEGKLLGHVISHQDISRFKELDEARRQFIKNVSHQLRTPVTTLRAQVYLMEKQASSDLDHDYIDMMKEQIDTLIHLIEDIIEMTVLDSGQAVRVWEPVLVRDIMTSLLERFGGQAAAAGLDFVVESGVLETWRVRGDSGRLLKALGKIIQNAIQFTSEGGRVTIAAAQTEQQGESWVNLVIADTGPGIPLEEQNKIFERFFQGRVAESGHVPGTGLGLSYAEEVIQAHGGEITVKSCEGKGATFVVRLPIAT